MTTLTSGDSTLIKQDRELPTFDLSHNLVDVIHISVQLIVGNSLELRRSCMTVCAKNL